MTDYSAWTQQMIAQAQATPSGDDTEETPEAIQAQQMADNLATGPLSQMLIENGPLIDAAISAYGVANVAAFFIDFGTSIAVVNGLDTTETEAGITEEEGKQ